MQDKAGIRFNNTTSREIRDGERKRAGWKALNYMLLGMCLMGALWAAVSFKFC